MGYACPVCETPQRDGEHLADHLAFTALLRGGEHEAWLDEHVPDWGERDADSLASDVTPHAADAEYHEVFEDTVRDRGRPDVEHRHDPAAEHRREREERPRPFSRTRDTGVGAGDGGDGAGALDAETRRALQEARELTRQARGDDDGGDSGGDVDEADGADDDG